MPAGALLNVGVLGGHDGPPPTPPPPPVYVPDEPPVERATTAGDELYAALEPLHLDDQARGYPLRSLCRSIGYMLQPVDDLARDTDQGPGWTRVLNADLAPREALPWLGQFLGVRVSAGAPAPVQRVEIKTAAGFRRGSVRAIREAAQAWLEGERRVLIRERDGSAYRLVVITYEAETPYPHAVEAAIRAQKPAGISLDYVVQSGQDYQTLEEGHDDYADVAASYTSYDDVRTDTPF